MKKEYVKPLLAVENFSLSQTIASACGNILSGKTQPNQSFVKSCEFTFEPYPGEEITVFIGDPCTTTPDAMPYICYNNSDDSSAVFYS